MRTGLIDARYGKLRSPRGSDGAHSAVQIDRKSVILDGSASSIGNARADVGHDSAGCVDCVLDALGKAVVEHRLFFPVSDLLRAVPTDSRRRLRVDVR